ncbi:MAG: isoprenylcysteine carboxylmethyltransferase family protein [Opitutaceae bacterium]|nr:isoprenylcysteine carboxylmethyltransferase family protein [Opitutaceae bacterium]
MPLSPETGFRLALAAIFVAVACIGIPHRLRADRAGGAVSRQSDPRWFWIATWLVTPVLALTCVAFLVQPRWVDFARLDAPAWLRGLGAPVGGAGAALFAWMFRHLGLNVTSTSVPRAEATLVTSGPYRWVRHPMYAATLLLVIAVTLLTANTVVLASGLAMFALLAARSRVEEQRLIGKFGDAYRAYQARTGRFLPRWSRTARAP